MIEAQFTFTARDYDHAREIYDRLESLIALPNVDQVKMGYLDGGKDFKAAIVTTDPERVLKDLIDEGFGQ